jgi:hypothetical protein
MARLSGNNPLTHGKPINSLIHQETVKSESTHNDTDRTENTVSNHVFNCYGGRYLEIGWEF